MATRSTIIVKLDGIWNAVQCHFDGYVEGVGSMLASHYSSQDKAENIIKLGCLSSLAETIEESKFYSRDCNEPYEMNKAVKIGNEDINAATACDMSWDVFDDSNFIYIFDDNEWKMYRYDKEIVIPVKSVIETEE